MSDQARLQSALQELDLQETGPIGTSPWITITQDDIDPFGAVTRDPDPMHIDPEWCRERGPLPTTIAYGFLSLSLITHMSHEAREWAKGTYALNYGFDRVRFVAPVPVGARITGHFSFVSAKSRDDGSILTTTEVSVEIDGEERPALTAEWLGVTTLGRPPFRPRAAAARRPALVRSRIRSHSNWSSAPKIWKTNRPVGVVVSMFSVSKRKPMFSASSLPTDSSRSVMLRPRRSRGHTTRASTSHKNASAAYIDRPSIASRRLR